VYDPAKDRVNIRKHGISLAQAEDFDFSTAYVRVDDRYDYGEVRYRAIGFLDALLYTLIFTEDANTVRAISLRRSTHQEHNQYEEN
jgi:uncharacterized DUF497 family protein